MSDAISRHRWVYIWQRSLVHFGANEAYLLNTRKTTKHLSYNGDRYNEMKIESTGNKTLPVDFHFLPECKDVRSVALCSASRYLPVGYSSSVNPKNISLFSLSAFRSAANVLFTRGNSWHCTGQYTRILHHVIPALLVFRRTTHCVWWATMSVPLRYHSHLSRIMMYRMYGLLCNYKEHQRNYRLKVSLFVLHTKL